MKNFWVALALTLVGQPKPKVNIYDILFANCEEFDLVS
jgi:hypothetical protein